VPFRLRWLLKSWKYITRHWQSSRTDLSRWLNSTLWQPYTYQFYLERGRTASTVEDPIQECRIKFSLPLYRLLVTLCNASFNFQQNSAVCAHSVLCVLYESQNQQQLFHCNRLVFVTVTDCDYYEVRNKSLCTIQVHVHTNLHLNVTLTIQTNGRSLGTFQKVTDIRKHCLQN
jgi:hypothetical protein